jgi:DNA helicase-2/ATP-dependent DNA helicase PcrA
VSDPVTEQLILEGLTEDQKKAVRSPKRCLLIVAGAGSGKTEVIARRIAWWVGVQNLPKDNIVAFTFTERAASEVKFRVRNWIEKITPEDEEVSLGQMFVGTIHGFCLAKIREFWPDDYHNYDILDEAGRAALILRGFHMLLGLQALRNALSAEGFEMGQYATMESFIQAYDQLHEHDRFDVALTVDKPPFKLGPEEQEWCSAGIRSFSCTLLCLSPLSSFFGF